MENTLENKAKFFAQYWGQMVLFSDGVRYSNNLKFGIENNEHLELKPLSLITDDDAIEVVAIIWGIEYAKDFFVNRNDRDFIKIIEQESDIEFTLWHCGGIDSLDEGEKYLGSESTLNIYDFLRSKSYALPYMGLSVEDLVSYGWVKLKNLNS